MREHERIAPRRRAAPTGRARPERAPRSRRRGTALEDALLEAAWEELSAVGYANLTMEGVAARAGTGKAVLYRRWPNRAQLLVAAVRRRTGSVSDDVPDTGDLREDVLAVLRYLARRQEEMGPDLIHGVMTDLHDLPRDFFDVVPGVMMTILRRAAARGEVRLEKLTPRIAALPGALVRHEVLLARSPVTEAFLAEIVDDIFLPLVRRDGP